MKGLIFMEKFINELASKLSTKFSNEQIVIIKEILYSTLKDFDVVPKCTDLTFKTTDYPRELKIYLVSRKIEGLSDNTLRQYKRELELFFGRVNKPLDKISAEDIRLYLFETKENGNLDNRTLDTKKNYISSFFKWLVNNDYLEKNPCKSIPAFKYEKKINKSLTDFEMEKLRNACENNYERAVVEVLYSTACRVSELTNIKFEDIDYDKKEINIVQGKGNKSRITFLNAKALLAIQEYVKDRDYPTVYLFEASKKPHNKLSTRSIEKVCNALEKRTGIRIHPHKLRRTTATNLWKKGMPLEEIKELLGHEELSTTLIYTYVDKETVKRDHLKYLS